MFNSIYSPGAIVTVVMGGYKHYAIVSDRWLDGKPMLISLSYRTGTVMEEAWDICVGRRKVELADEQGETDFRQVLSKARSMVGNVAYNFWKTNCEHFARWTHGLRVESKQIKNYLIFATGIVVAFLVIKKR